MKSKKYLEFREKHLEKYNAYYNEYLMAQWNSEWNERLRKMRNQLETVIANVVALQQQVPIEIGCIQISLLLSSIQTGHPELMYEVYDAGMEFGTLLYAQTFQTDWFIADWTETRKKIENEIKKLNWQSYLGKEEISAMFYENIDIILASLTYMLKYEFKDFMTYKKAEQLVTTDGFYLSMGEYRGWKRVLYQYVEPKDILQQGLDKEFSYMFFSECHYKEKRLAGFRLDNTRFEKCVFLKTIFHRIDFRDADFKECIFRECVFENCILNGTVFEECDMQRIEWNENQIKSGAIVDEEGNQDIYRPTLFVKCILHKHDFKKNIIAGCLKIACDEEGIVDIENEIL